MMLSVKRGRYGYLASSSFCRKESMLVDSVQFGEDQRRVRLVAVLRGGTILQRKPFIELSLQPTNGTSGAVLSATDGVPVM